MPAHGNRALPRSRTFRRRARAVVAAGVAAATSWSSLARADDATEFELGKNRFDGGQYEEAAKRFGVLLGASGAPCSGAAFPCRLSEPDYIERARALHAVSLIAMKRVPEAEAQILAIFLENPAYAPSATFPAEVLDRFTEVKAKNRDTIQAAADAKAKIARDKLLGERAAREAERARLALLERYASEERVVEKNSRLLALIPFGVGQFQNGDPSWGWFFAVSELLAGGASTVTAVAAHDIGSALHEEDVDPTAAIARRDAFVTANRISFASWALLAVAGVVHAEVTYVPQRETVKKRPLPPPVRSTLPTVSVTPGGAVVGLTGRF